MAAADDEVDEEIRSHLAMAVRDRVDAGEDPAEAQHAVRREFGNITLTVEATRGVWRNRLHDLVADLAQDVRYTFRLLARSPAFTLVVVAVLALGIGANTQVFNLFKSVFLRPLPAVQRPGELTIIAQRTRGGRTIPLSYRDVQYVREHNTSFSSVNASAMVSFNVGLGTRGERVWGEMVSGSYFNLLQVRAALGRTLVPDDETVGGGQPVAVMSDGLWRRLFGADPAIVGKTLLVNGVPLTVVGVTQPGFRGSIVGVVLDLYVPVTLQPRLYSDTDNIHDPNAQWLITMGRLKPGTSVQAADAQIRVLSVQEEQADPERARDHRAFVAPLSQSPFGAQPFLGPVVAVLAAMSALLLGVVCANLANLVTVRGLARRAEIGIRLALGASRARIVRLLLIENAMLSVAGGAAGLVVSDLLLRSMDDGGVQIAPFPTDLDLSTDALVIGFALAVSCVTAACFGFAPAMRSSRVDLTSVIKDDGSLLAPARSRLRGALVVSQIALSVALLVGAALVDRSLNAVHRASFGFDPQHVATIATDIKPSGYDERRGRQFYETLLQRARSSPGMVSASLAAAVPLQMVEGWSQTIGIDGYAPRKNEDLSFSYNIVTPDYFRTLQIGTAAGRGFDAHDTQDAAPAAIVNETMARRFWPSPSDAIGKRLRISDRWHAIVGVVHDVKYFTVAEDPRPYFYLAFDQHYSPYMNMHVRGAAAAADLVEPMRAIVRALDPNLPIADARTLSDQMQFAFIGYEMAASALGMFGAIAVGLASVGLYGLIAYAVKRSTHEIGIRMALGAGRGDVLRAFLGRGMRFTAVGTAAGVLGAAAVTRLMGSVLFGVAPTDPRSFATASAIVVAVATVACLLPAWKAARTDPAVALRRS